MNATTQGSRRPACEGASSPFARAGAAGKGRSARAESANGSLAVELVTSRESLLGLSREWNALVEETDDQPFYRHEFVTSWIASFAPRAPLRLLVARARDGSLAALLPLVARRGSILHLPVREWSSPSDVHSARFDLLARDPEAAAFAFLARLRAERGWDVVRIADVPESGAANALLALAERAGSPVGTYEAQRSPYLRLPGSPAALPSAWSSKWRSNLKRRRRLLERHGELSFRRIDAGDPELPGRLELCFAIEASGWKGRRGDPVNRERRCHDFYVALARPHDGRSGFALDLLELDGRPIAFHYGFERAGRYSLLLTGHDERYREGAPGHLLTERLIELSVERGLSELDFLGCDLEWKRSWTKRTRQHRWLYLFRDSRWGALLARAKFGWAPMLQRLLAGPRRAPGGAAAGFGAVARTASR